MITRVAAFDRLTVTFRRAASARADRPGIDVASGELSWVRYEREQMHAEVDRIRAVNGLPPIDPECIRSAELTSTGHVDYAQKFALRCADLTQP